jgi:hypothetical protein
MTAYQTAILHIERHAYKRGAHKGDAPADTDRRSKNHFRVIALTGRCVVRFHNANIITAYENGDIEFDARGWVDSNTTRAAFATALSALNMGHMIGQPHSHTYRSARHTVVRAGGKTYVYYDGMRFNGAGELVTEPRPFQETRIDKEETAELARGLKESGFKDMFKMIYATCTPDTSPSFGFLHPQNLRDKLTDNDRSVDWHDIVAAFKYERQYRGHFEYHEKGTASSCWSALMKIMKQSMYNTRDTTTFVL